MNRIPGEIEKRIIEGRSIEVRYEEVPLDQISLDPANPRISEIVLRHPKKGANLNLVEILKIIFDEPEIQQLQKSIRDNGGLIEPVFLDSSGRVVEGNRRAAVLMRLRETLGARGDKRWEEIPAWRLPNGTSKREVAVLQGQFHVSGKKPWRSHEKAGHLRHMNLELKMTVEEIARSLGLPEREVSLLLEAHEMMTKLILPQMQNGTGLDRFSYAYEFVKNPHLEDFRAKASNREEFAKWVADGKLKRGDKVRDLPKILKDPHAKATLERQGHDKAIKVLGKKDPTVDSMFFKKIESTTKLLSKTTAEIIDRLKKEKNAQQLLHELFAALQNTAKAAGLVLKS
jgi:predicted transcriptional regulator